MKNQVLSVCPVCGKSKMRYKSQSHLQTCSKECGFKLIHEKHIISAQKKCTVCGKVFVPKRSDAIGLYCSYICMGVANSKPIIMRNGYKYIHLPDHPNASKQGYFAEHRYIMEQSIGRCLDKKEIVHHINHNKSDNRIENLMLFESPGCHAIKVHTHSRSNKGVWIK